MWHSFLALEHNMVHVLQHVQEQIGDMTQPSGNKLILATEEAVLNVMRYSGSPHVHILCRQSTEQGKEVLIKDQGFPFNPLEHLKTPSEILQNTFEKDGGYGIYLMHAAVDNIVYQRENNSNILILSKYG
ncbi:MAG: ATP-binding protein [Parachlamydiaceae bacterium]|nr:ATP-binding protein [Parachlamydiaceae bacterium]